MHSGKTGRAFRSKKQDRWPEPAREPMPWLLGESDVYEHRVIPEDMPSPGVPVEERQRWILEHEGPGVFAPEVLDELRERVCALPGCDSMAKRGSLFCSYHHKTALGEQGTRELRQLHREMERLANVADRAGRREAIAKFRSRVEGGDFAVLFAQKTQETLECAAADLDLDLELGALRVGLARAVQEIEDPREMSLAVARLSNAAVRASRANAEMRRGRKSTS